MLRGTAPVLALALAGCGAAGAVPTQQSQVCTDRAIVLGHLATEYAEAPIGMGIANNGGVIEILASRDGKTWTLILTMPNGTTCMIAAGESWEALPGKVSLGPPA